MTGQPTGKRRLPADARSLPNGEWERLLRERVYLRPIPVAPPLHVMARRRIVTVRTDSTADVDHQADDNTNLEDRK